MIITPLPYHFLSLSMTWYLWAHLSIHLEPLDPHTTYTCRSITLATHYHLLIWTFALKRHQIDNNCHQLFAAVSPLSRSGRNLILSGCLFSVLLIFPESYLIFNNLCVCALISSTWPTVTSMLADIFILMSMTTLNDSLLASDTRAAIWYILIKVQIVHKSLRILLDDWPMKECCYTFHNSKSLSSHSRRHIFFWVLKKQYTAYNAADSCLHFGVTARHHMVTSWSAR